MSIKNPVRKLNPEVARKIAAGEVIDRPNAIIRELLDNAIDSGADNITVEISEGGIEKIRVVDNGSGMTEEDLKNCAKPHSTSKISSENDLLNLSTLGFRGEALASIAAVSRLQIISGGFKMKSSITEDHIIERIAETKGTIVQSEGLFENFPARRVFLKRPATEGTLCKNTFIEKSLPFPEKSFRFINNNQIKIDLYKTETLKERFVKALEFNENVSLFNEINFSENSKPYSFKIIIGEPSVYRSTKKDIYIFVNGRRIQEFSLIQAIEYGSQGFFPNGTFPVSALFVKIDSSLVDFNIHPAKKEVRFKDIQELHHDISSSVRNFFINYTQRKLNNFSENSNLSNELFKASDLITKKTEKIQNFKEETQFPQIKKYNYSGISEKNNNFEQNSEIQENKISGYEKFVEEFKKKHPEYSTNHKNSEIPQIKKTKEDKIEEIENFVDKVLENYTKSEIQQKTEEKETKLPENVEKKEICNSKNTDAKFIGSCLGTFIIEEFNDSLYIIDKHAAHERILFNKIMENQHKSQNLLIPEEFFTETESDDKYLISVQQKLEEIGFKIEMVSGGKWKIYSVNERFNDSVCEFVKKLLQDKIKPEEIIYEIAATTACKAAIKDGGFLDDIQAHKLAVEALNLPDPHCPHGRPIFTIITREKLFELVRRT